MHSGVPKPSPLSHPNFPSPRPEIFLLDIVLRLDIVLVLSQAGIGPMTLTARCPHNKGNQSPTYFSRPLLMPSLLKGLPDHPARNDFLQHLVLHFEWNRNGTG